MKKQFDIPIDVEMYQESNNYEKEKRRKKRNGDKQHRGRDRWDDEYDDYED